MTNGVVKVGPVFFSFSESDRQVVASIKTNAERSPLGFAIKRLIERHNVEDQATIDATIRSALKGCSRTIVFVGHHTDNSVWVPREVQLTLDSGKPVLAMRLKGASGTVPKCLDDAGVKVYRWSEARLRNLATQRIQLTSTTKRRR